jgi:Zn-dependent protease with chaperone function
MRLDSANRNFLSFMGVTLLMGAYVLCGAVGGVLVPLLLMRVSHSGPAKLPGDGASLLPSLLIVVLAAGGLVLATLSLTRQALASYRLARRVRGLALALPDQLARTAVQVGLRGRVVLVVAPESFSFVYGALTPRIAISRGLFNDCSDEELRAVLEHERYHVRNLDPLKMMSMQALSAALFFMPALDALRARYAAARELAADRHAVAVCGRRPLVGALLKVVGGPEWSELEVAAAIGGPELLHVRVAQLETGRQPKLATLSITHATISLIGVTLLVAMFLVSVSSFGGPASVRVATGTGVLAANLLGGFSCAVPFAGTGLVAYWLLARRASHPLESDGERLP